MMIFSAPNMNARLSKVPGWEMVGAEINSHNDYDFSVHKIMYLVGLMQAHRISYFFRVVVQIGLAVACGLRVARCSRIFAASACTMCFCATILRSGERAEGSQGIV